jgi:multiple sugar transport system permease protein
VIERLTGRLWAGNPADKSRALKRGALYLVAVGGAVVVFSPFLVVLSTSLTTRLASFSYPPHLLPHSLQFGNYSNLLLHQGFGRYLTNSLIVVTVATGISLVVDAMAGYSFARLRFRGRQAVFVIMLATIMIPIQITMIPLYIMFRHAPLYGGNDILGAGGSGLLNSYPGLILPGIASTFGIYLMREFFRLLPGDLLDAGRVDGLSEWRIFARIYVPLAKPAIATVAIISFTDGWNQFMWPLLITSSQQMYTVQLGLAQFRGQYFTNWNLLMAGVVLTCLPVFVIFILGQRHFVKAMALSGLKG